MQVLIDGWETAGAVLFSLLAIVALIHLAVRRDNTARWAAACFVTLAAVAVGYAASPEIADSLAARTAAKVLMAGLALVPLLLFLFAMSFRKGPRWLTALALLLALAAAAGPFIFERLPEKGEAFSEVYEGFFLGYVAQAVLLCLVATVSLWRSGKGRSGVARKRMNTLALGALALAATFALAGVWREEPETAGTLVATRSSAGVAAGLFLIGLAPPASFRSLWRRADGVRLDKVQTRLVEGDAAADQHTLLLPAVLALVGAEKALLIGDEGRPMARYPDEDEEGDSPSIDSPAGRRIVKVPFGRDQLVVEASRFAPLLGKPEVQILKRVGLFTRSATERPVTDPDRTYPADPTGSPL